jgi:hypothetical protein
MPLGEAFQDEQHQVEEDNRGPGMLRSEVERAVKELKNGKAPGEDKIIREVKKSHGEKDVLHGIIQDCSESRELPGDFTRSSMATVAKRARPEK